MRLFLSAGFALLLGLTVLALRSELAVRNGEAEAESVERTQTGLAALLFTVQQAETAQRGYLITGDAGYLAPYQKAAAQVPDMLRQLGGAVDISAVQPAIDAKMDELQATLGMAQAGRKDAALAAVRSNIGLFEMQRIGAWVAQEQAGQALRLAVLDLRVQHRQEVFELAALAGVLATMVLGMGVLRGHQVQTLQVLDLNEELNRIFTLTADILAVVSADGRLLSLNPAWTRITGLPAGGDTGLQLADAVHPDDWPQVAVLLAAGDGEGQPHQGEIRLRKADGGYAWIAWRAVRLPGGGQLYAIGRDVTEDRAREEQLRQSQKMEVVGQLTGGIAHDFNNLLTVIMGSLELLQRDLGGADARAERRIEAAMDGARRAAALTYRLLAFARRQPLDPRPVQPNELVAGMSEILHRALGEHITLTLVRGAGLWTVLADGHQLENAILNLAVNARDAMAGGGQLSIETQNVTLDAAYAAAEPEVTAGDYAMIAVTDTGAGMAPAVAAHVFEPFFTTKPVGHGTGLGLAQVYGFIKQSRGHVKIYSELGRGTSVKLYLPRLGAAPAPPAAEQAAPAEGRARGETVLVVEDEEVVRAFAAEVLRDYGYAVIAVENAAEALPVIRAGRRIDLLFTDVVLTGAMDGRQLAAALCESQPGAKVLFTTGYTHNAILQQGGLAEDGQFLGKPFTAQALAQKLREMLD